MEHEMPMEGTQHREKVEKGAGPDGDRVAETTPTGSLAPADPEIPAPGIEMSSTLAPPPAPWHKGVGNVPDEASALSEGFIEDSGAHFGAEIGVSSVAPPPVTSNVTPEDFDVRVEVGPKIEESPDLGAIKIFLILVALTATMAFLLKALI